MVIRQLKAPKYDRFCQDLQALALTSPRDPSYTVPLVVNGTEYQIKLQPEDHNRIAILYALRVDRMDRPTYELITANVLLSAFLELLLEQGLPQ